MKILAAGHDAGGANQLLARDYPGEVTFILTGPGSAIARKKEIPHCSEISFLDTPPFDLVVVGSNSQYQLSDEILDYAIALKIPTVGVLEHWVNFSNRWNKSPDIVEVTDIRAFIGAFLQFGFKVRLRQNRYLREIEKELKGVRESGSGLLLIGQPLAERIDHGEWKCFCKAVENFFAKFPSAQGLIIREHFDTDLSECARYLEIRIGGSVRISPPYSSLALDLSVSKYVLGIDSYALYISSRLGKKVFSIKQKRRSWFAPRYPFLH